MKSGWYVVNYHDVNWESSFFTRGIGGTVSPDMFRNHLETLRKQGTFIPVQEGIEIMRQGKSINLPLFSLWFDDGFVGIRKYALPICREFGITGAVSVCSRFVQRQEMFWRSILSFLGFIDGHRILRTRLRPFGYKAGESIKDWSLKHFSLEVLKVINDVYVELTSDIFRKDAFRIFEDEEGLKVLSNNGWLIAGHSAAHYPVGPQYGHDSAVRQFEECAPLVSQVQGDPSIWVLPFPSPYIEETRGKIFLKRMAHYQSVLIVCVEEKVNTPATFQEYGVVFRFSPSWHDANRPPFAV